MHFTIMKTVYLIIPVLALFLSTCESEEGTVRSDSINTILPLGASRVEGARPAFESFRYELWKDLIDGGWTFDYVGTRRDPASYPEYKGRDFDRDHEGRGGFTAAEILSELENWLTHGDAEVAPDIVLFSSPGGNDALQNLSYSETLISINAIIDLLQEANPEVTIVMELLAPGRSDIMTPELTAYFDQLNQDLPAIADQQSTASSRVLIVDMATGFSDALLADEVHYNEAGAAFVADRYYPVLEGVLVSGSE